MAGDDSDDINIPALFIGEDGTAQMLFVPFLCPVFNVSFAIDGITIAEYYQYMRGFKLLLTNEQPFNLNNYLLPFAIGNLLNHFHPLMYTDFISLLVVVAICFLLMLVFFVVKCVKDRRRMRR